MLAWLVLVLVLWRAAVVEMWKYKIPPFKVWLGGGGEEILGSKCGHYLRPRVKLGQTVAFIDSTF